MISSSMSLTQKIALVGHTGLVGSNLKQQSIPFTHLFNSKNIKDIEGQTFDVVYFAGLPAEKWKINKEPEKDVAVIEQLKTLLQTVKCRQFILISTIDVYKLGLSERFDEDSDLTGYINEHHAYGKHRWQFERFVEQQFPNHLIVRLPALFGPYLKKNYIYDMLHDNGVQNIKRNSCFQWYDLTRLSRDIAAASAAQVRLINLFPEPVNTSDIIELALKCQSVPQTVIDKIPQVASDAATILYEIKTNYGSVFGSKVPDFIYSAADTLEAIQNYFIAANMERKVVISNIAWNVEDEAENESILRLITGKYNVRQIEVGPTKYWGTNWDKVHSALKSNDVAKVRNQLKEQFNVSIPSYQAVLFNCPTSHLFGNAQERQTLIEHMKFIADLCAQMSLSSNGADQQIIRAPAIVFGAPKNRKLNGMSRAEGDQIATATFRELGDYCKQKNVVICLEANPTDYGADYMTTSAEAAKLVRDIDHTNVKLHVDLACMYLAKEDIERVMADNIDIIYHVHISEPFLEEIVGGKCPHHQFAQCLKAPSMWWSDVKYSIEMKNAADTASNFKRVDDALSFVRRCYFSG